MNPCALALLGAALLFASASVGSAHDAAQATSTPTSDYIRAEIRGRLRVSAAGDGRAERFQVSANDLAWDLDLSGNDALMQEAQRLEGRPVRVVGTYAEQRDAAGVRRFLVAETLQPEAARRRGERIDVTLRGTLRSRVMAIGAETTGVTLDANGVVWELELRGRQLETAGDLDGAKVVVAGRVVHRRGVETGSRFVVKVRAIKASVPASSGSSGDRVAPAYSVATLPCAFAVLAWRSRSVSSSARVGGAVFARRGATSRFHPVDALTCSTVMPGCSAVSVSSRVTGCGVRTPRSVITAVGPWPRAPDRARESPPSR